MTIPADLKVYRSLFLRDLEEHRSPKTAKIYGNAVNRYAEFLDTLEAEPDVEAGLVIEPGTLHSISDATRDHTKAFLRWLRDQRSQRDGEPLSGGYRSNIYRGLQAFWRWMVINDYCDHNPTANIDGPSVEEDLVPVLEHDVLKAILDTCGKGRWDRRRFVDVRDEAILRVFMDAGLRCSEQLVTLDRLNPKQRTITVVGKGRNGKSKIRTVSYGEKTTAALRFYLLARDGYPQAQSTDHLWVGRWGPMTASGIYQTVVDRGAEAGFTVHPHQFRHTCALHLKLRGEPDHVVMAHMGWDSPTMVTRYARIANERVAGEAIKRCSLGDLI